MIPENPVSIPQLLRLPQVQAIIPVSRQTIHRWIKSGTFPIPVKLCAGITAWRANEVSAWIETRQQVESTTGRTLH